MVQRMLWALAGVALVAGVVLFARGDYTVSGGCGLVALLAVLGAGTARRERDRRAFESRFGSVDALRAELDRERFRAIEDQHGRPAAIKALRQTYPGLTLSDANDLMASSV
ncbi:hypothetical protein [Allokutzneria oryzae]|uniref:Uncharacterized protein n=1 Tax=Allokutzneria oryzae TaxID=1378989 RepID=A0ABV5ZTN5_9PSEU